MRLEVSEPEEIKLNMTAMIDIVFQLLVFFIMTFKVVTMEGDFTVKMPMASQNASSIDDVLPDIITVALRAGEDGKINSIIVDGDETFAEADMYRKLTQLIESRLGAEADPENEMETEVEFDIDYGLKYSYTVKAIEAVSGKVENGVVKKLIEKVKFKDNKKPDGDI
ncbi:MAG: ExbD/TolR family protein [Mariniblastus sp.]